MSRTLRQHSLRKLDRVVMDAARDVLGPHGFELDWGVGSTHPYIAATRDGLVYALTYANPPRSDELSQAMLTRQKARRVLSGAHAPLIDGASM